MSVIISRALPDARDGLKPSQRRILLAMHDLSLFPKPPASASAPKFAATTSGNYHPHGEAVIYPTLVSHGARPWAMRDGSWNGQGNFGSVEGDPPAAMRVTPEARMTHLAAALKWEDMDQDTVDFVPNYDETRTEADRFPQPPFPICSSTAARASPSAWPRTFRPHNLGEIIDGVCAQIDDRTSRSRA